MPNRSRTRVLATAMSCITSSAVAAPVFSEVVQQTLRMMGVQPDMDVKPQIVANAVEESF